MDPGLLAFALAAAPLQAGAPVPPVRARASRPDPVGDMDYPASALRAGEEGVVDYEIGVGADGRVTDCRIVASSGSAILDSATCRAIRARARFAPARDSAGRPTADRLRGRVGWRLPAAAPGGARRAQANVAGLFGPGNYPAPALRLRQEGAVGYRIRVGPDGRADRCTILVSSRVPVLDRATCRILKARARFEPALDGDGRPTFDTLTGSMTWRLPR